MKIFFVYVSSSQEIVFEGLEIQSFSVIGRHFLKEMYKNIGIKAKLIVLLSVINDWNLQIFVSSVMYCFMPLLFSTAEKKILVFWFQKSWSFVKECAQNV